MQYQETHVATSKLCDSQHSTQYWLCFIEQIERKRQQRKVGLIRVLEEWVSSQYPSKPSKTSNAVQTIHGGDVKNYVRDLVLGWRAQSVSVTDLLPTSKAEPFLSAVYPSPTDGHIP